MLQKIMLNTIWGRAILVFTFAGVLLRMITALSYKGMKNAAENAGKTKKQWVLTLKKRFENYERFGQVGNVESFVEHYFSRKGIFGIPLGFWDKSTYFFALASLLTGVAGTFSAMLMNQEVRSMLVYLFSGTVSAIFLFMLHMIGDTKKARRQILIALTDYFANGISGRGRSEEKGKLGKIPTKAEVESLSEAAVTEEEKQVLMDVLEDYFW